MNDLLIRNAEVEGEVCDVRVRDGVIAEIGSGVRCAGEDLDARGGALIPGLHDHHVHLLATAAAAQSVDLGPARLQGLGALTLALQQADATLPNGVWLRGVNYHDSVAGALTAEALDRLVPRRPVRVQYATGSLWVLNSAALAQIADASPRPDCVELDDGGRPTGRIWRGDAWLRAHVPHAAPALDALGSRLAQMGITGVCDASATTDDASARLIASAVGKGALRQRVMLMSGGRLAPNPAYAIGPVKILLDEAALPDVDEVTGRISAAHAWERNAAIHCVTAAELALALAAFEAVGVRAGDRIEHGGVICAASALEIARLGLTVVTQPGFIAERGDRYLRETPEEDHDALYPCASLLRAGVRVAASTDAPYTTGDVWAAMRAAVSRETASGRIIGPRERVSARRALALFLGALQDPGGPKRRVRVGAPADLCLLDRPLADALGAAPDNCVAATFVGGRCTFARRDVSADLVVV